jgi:hypothetical protein
MTVEEIQDRFRYYSPSIEGAARHAELSEAFASLAVLVDDICPDGREKSLVLTKLEEGKFWASAAVARDQSTR